MPTSTSKRLIALSTLAACGVLAAACGSSDTTGGTGGHAAASSSATTGSGGATSSSTSASTGGSGPVCMGPGFGGGEMPVTGGTVTAKIVDETGAAVPNQPIFICGLDLCTMPAKTAADGTASIMTGIMMKKPAFKFGDGIAYAEFGIPLTMPSTDFMTIATAKMPSAGAVLTPGADATSNGVTVSIPAGAEVVIDDLVYGTPDQQKFRATAIPIAAAKPILDPMMLGFEMLYGIAPATTTICPAAKITVPNTPMWPANTAVEFWTTTVDVAQTYAPYAGWAKISDGAVSADGKTVVTADGAGFEYLDHFGVRKK